MIDEIFSYTLTVSTTNPASHVVKITMPNLPKGRCWVATKFRITSNMQSADSLYITLSDKLLSAHQMEYSNNILLSEVLQYVANIVSEMNKSYDNFHLLLPDEMFLQGRIGTSGTRTFCFRIFAHQEDIPMADYKRLKSINKWS